MNATILVDSDSGVGATFSVYIPGGAIAAFERCGSSRICGR